jgi:hypothetical protein
MPHVFRLLVVVTALYAAFPGAQPAAAQRRKDDVVTLKDGRVIRGTIVENFPTDSTFLMRLPDGTFVRYNKADIAQVEQQKSVREGEGRLGHKQPVQAWAWSLLFPGGGQIYNGDVAKGVAAAVVAGVGAALYFSVDPDACMYFPEDCHEDRRTAGAAIFVIVWVASQIEAPITANAINRKNSQGVTVGVGPEPHKLGVSLMSLRF